MIVPLAQRLGSMAKPYTDPNALFGRADQDGSTVVVPASEQSFVKYQEEHPDAQLKAVVPATGTLSLDYPIVVTAKSEAEQATDAAKALAAELLTDGVQPGPRRTPASGTRSSARSSGGRGVGDITQLTKPTGEAIDKTLLNWTRLSLSTHSLAVIDISGSMAEKVGKQDPDAADHRGGRRRSRRCSRTARPSACGRSPPRSARTAPTTRNWSRSRRCRTGSARRSSTT